MKSSNTSVNERLEGFKVLLLYRSLAKGKTD